nr:tetratricopeptide-like helical domain, DYW domain protein [Tanacetum cinerariifolium]
GCLQSNSTAAHRSKWLDVESAHGDILRHGFLPGYTEWTVHGEHTISLPASQSTNVNVEETFFVQEEIKGLVRDALALMTLGIVSATRKWLDVESAHRDILRHGFLPGYTEWTVHGEHTISLPASQSTNVNVEETFFVQEEIRGLVRDALGINSLSSDNTQLGDTTIEGDTEEYTVNGDHGDEGVS